MSIFSEANVYFCNSDKNITFVPGTKKNHRHHQKHSCNFMTTIFFHHVKHVSCRSMYFFAKKKTRKSYEAPAKPTFMRYMWHALKLWDKRTWIKVESVSKFLFSAFRKWCCGFSSSQFFFQTFFLNSISLPFDSRFDVCYAFLWTIFSVNREKPFDLWFFHAPKDTSRVMFIFIFRSLLCASFQYRFDFTFCIKYMLMRLKDPFKGHENVGYISYLFEFFSSSCWW